VVNEKLLSLHPTPNVEQRTSH